MVVFGGSLCFCDTVEDDASDVPRQCRRSHCSLVATDGLLTPMVRARLNQMLALVSDSAIGFPNQVRRVFHLTSRSSESRDHSLTAMASMVDDNKHNSDQTAKGP